MTVQNFSTDPLTMVFEPSAEEVELAPHAMIRVTWPGEQGAEIAWRPDLIQIGSPPGGGLRAWDSDGDEIPGLP